MTAARPDNGPNQIPSAFHGSGVEGDGSRGIGRTPAAELPRRPKVLRQCQYTAIEEVEDGSSKTVSRYPRGGVRKEGLQSGGLHLQGLLGEGAFKLGNAGFEFVQLIERTGRNDEEFGQHGIFKHTLSLAERSERLKGSFMVGFGVCVSMAIGHSKNPFVRCWRIAKGAGSRGQSKPQVVCSNAAGGGFRFSALRADRGAGAPASGPHYLHVELGRAADALLRAPFSAGVAHA